MLKTIFVLGRQPELGFAELERVSSDLEISKFSVDIAVSDQSIDKTLINRLGGTLKIAQVEASFSSVSWSEVENAIKDTFVEKIANLPEGKINLGLSYYGKNIDNGQLNRSALSLKKLVKAEGRSVRVVPNNEPALSTAQVQHNKLTSETGFEIVIVNNGKETLLGRTTSIQNINAYAARDQVRPKRDAKVGMLPPKLAQIMINIASPTDSSTVLDPFCGTGVVLQEALLMGYDAFGTDVDERMIKYSEFNLEWLESNFDISSDWQVQVGDATTHKWNVSDVSVVSETYLGKPLFQYLVDDELYELVDQVNKLIRNFLVNIADQLPSGTNLCIAVPAWRHKQGFKTLPLLDQLEEIGYNHLSFKTVNTRELIYNRPQQLVARQLLSLKRK